MNRVNNMQQLVSLALTYKSAYVYGGYVRDTIIRSDHDKVNDIDIRFEDEEELYHFMDILKVVYGNKFENHGIVYDYHEIFKFDVHKLNIDGIDMDISILKDDSSSRPEIDFTCNIFGFNKDGIFLHCDKPKESMVSHNFFIDMFDLTKKKEFAILPFTNRSNNAKEYIHTCMHLMKRANKMISRGWKMVDLYNYFSITSNTQNVNNCCICLDSLSKNTCIQSKCKHDFHYECMKTYLQSSITKESNDSLKCPICRRKNFLL